MLENLKKLQGNFEEILKQKNSEVKLMSIKKQFWKNLKARKIFVTIEDLTVKTTSVQNRKLYLNTKKQTPKF